MKNILLKALPYAASAILFTCSTSVHANQLCEYGRISFLQLAGGGDSLIRVSVTPGTKDELRHLKRQTGNTYATEMRWQVSSMRWADRLALLSQAHATQSLVSIYSSDNNCIGPIDEFEITLLD